MLRIAVNAGQSSSRNETRCRILASAWPSDLPGCNSRTVLRYSDSSTTPLRREPQFCLRRRRKLTRRPSYLLGSKGPSTARDARAPVPKPGGRVGQRPGDTTFNSLGVHLFCHTQITSGFSLQIKCERPVHPSGSQKVEATSCSDFVTDSFRY
jgi:hypothetical protein